MDAIVCLLQREYSHPLWLIKPHVAFSLRMVFLWTDDNDWL